MSFLPPEDDKEEVEETPEEEAMDKNSYPGPEGLPVIP